MLLPFLILGGIIAIAFASAGSPRERPYLPAGRGTAPPAAQGPIATLHAYAAAGYLPPPAVVLCAIAEAETMGRNDLAHSIYRHYMPQPPPAAHAPPIDVASAPGPQMAAAPAPVGIGPAGTTSATDAEIQALLDADPHGFVQGAVAGELDHHVAQARRAPIEGVPEDAWEGFCNRLAREEPTFSSDRHIGRYRQHRERLREIGIDPTAIAGSPDAQRDAFDAEIADAHRHVVASGMDRNIGRVVRLPGLPEPVEVTMSGVLGIAHAAGLEHAASWLQHQRDRQQFPHTTEAFVRTNGLF